MDKPLDLRTRKRNRKESLGNQGTDVDFHDDSNELPSRIRLVHCETEGQSDLDYQKVIPVPFDQRAEDHPGNGYNYTPSSFNEGSGSANAVLSFSFPFADEIPYDMQDAMQYCNPQILSELDSDWFSTDQLGQAATQHRPPGVNIGQNYGVDAGHKEVAPFYFEAQRNEPQMSIGVDLNSRNFSRQSLLHYAPEHVNRNAAMQNAPLTQYGCIAPLLLTPQQSDPRTFVSHGVDLNSRNVFGQSLPHYTSEYGIRYAALQNAPQTHEYITLFHLAARLMLDNGVDLNLRDSFGQSLLHYAAACCNKPIVEMLLDKGVDVNIKGHNQSTPLHLAAGCNTGTQFEISDLIFDNIKKYRKETVSLLLSRKANVNVKDGNGLTALYLAAAAGHVEIVRLLLYFGARWFTRSNCYHPLYPQQMQLCIQYSRYVAITKDTRLHLSVLMNRYRAANVLLRKGFSVNAKNKYQETPLHIACKYNHDYITSRLLMFGPSFYAKDRKGETPLHIAVKHGYTKVVQALLDYRFRLNVKNNKQENPLHIAAKYNRGDTARILVKTGSEIYAKDRYGQTPLHIAARYDYKTVAGALVQSAFRHTCPCNVKNRNQETPLHVAARFNHADVARMLLEFGLSNFAKDRNGDTPLHIAARNGKREVVEILLQFKSNRYIKNKKGFTPLDLAKLHGHIDTETAIKAWKPYMSSLFYLASQQSDPQMLLDNGGDLNSNDIFGQSLLHYAAASGNTPIVEMLLNKVIGVNIKGCSDNAPLHVPSGGRSCTVFQAMSRETIDKCSKDTVSKTLNRNPDINAKGFDGNTALHYAAAAGHIGIIRLLLDFGARWFERNKKKDTFLHSAARHGRLEVVDAFIEQFDSPSEKIEHVNEDSMPLHCIDKSKTVEFVVNIKIEYILNTSDVAEFLRLERKEMNITKLLLKKNIVQNYIHPNNFAGLLHDLPYLLREWDAERYIKLLEILLASGELNVNSLDSKADTPLHRLIKNGNTKLPNDTVIKTLQLLLKNNANVNARNRYGSTPLMLAALNEEITQILLESKEETGIPVELDAQNMNGETALIIAAKLRKKEAVKLLLQHRASVNLNDHQGSTPLHSTFYRSSEDDIISDLENQYDILKLLLEACPSAVNDVDLGGNTVFDLAKKYVRCRHVSMECPENGEEVIHEKIMDILKEYGGVLKTMQECDFVFGNQLYGIEKFIHDKDDCPGLFDYMFRSPKNDDLYNTLQYVTCERGNFIDLFSKNDLLKIIESESRKRRTALHYAVISLSRKWTTVRNMMTDDYDKIHNVRRDVFKKLIELGCDVNALDSHGRTPLHYVDEEDLFHTFTEKMGANENIPDFYGHTAGELFQLREQTRHLLAELYESAGYNRKKSKYDIKQFLKTDSIKANMAAIKSVEGRRTSVQGSEMSTSSYAWKIWSEGEFAFKHITSSTLTKEIAKFMEKLAEGVTLRDSRFECKSMFVGSSFEGTKIGLPDEYDFNFVLTKLNQHCTIVGSPTAPSGFVHLTKRISSSTASDSECLENLQEFFNSDGFFICDKVLRKFKMLVFQSLSDIDHDLFEVYYCFEDFKGVIEKIELNAGLHDWEPEDAKLCLTLELEMIRPVENWILEMISIDIAPCVHFDGFWPEEAKLDISDELKAVGCNLVFDRPQRKYPWVPFSDPYARISFALAESTIIRDSPLMLKAAYMVLKHIIEPKMTFMLKNALLYVIEAQSSNIRIRQISKYDDITAEDLNLTVRNIMFCFVKFHEQDFFPSYFMPSFSVPVGEFLKSEHMSMWAEAETRRLEDLFTHTGEIRDDFQSFLDYLELCPNGTSENFCLPIPRPLYEHFDKESLFESLSRIS